MADLKTYINVREAATLLDVQPGTIYQLVWQKRIPSYKPLGKKLLFCKEELLQIISAKRQSTQDEIETSAATASIKRGAK